MTKTNYQGEFQIGGIYKLGRQRTELVRTFDERGRCIWADYETSYKELTRRVVRETPSFIITADGEKWKKTTILNYTKIDAQTVQN